ncbi:hypothetical protein V6N11_082053 [Hibiscus sabdariffa]|uniref:Uncharacterized protein n=1 Tax=Hibiscus sabdariffa TaxID=183260 RepID=A0ABR2QH94_9ROSI
MASVVTLLATSMQSDIHELPGHQKLLRATHRICVARRPIISNIHWITTIHQRIWQHVAILSFPHCTPLKLVAKSWYPIVLAFMWLKSKKKALQDNCDTSKGHRRHQFGP